MSLKLPARYSENLIFLMALLALSVAERTLPSGSTQETMFVKLQNLRQKKHLSINNR